MREQHDGDRLDRLEHDGVRPRVFGTEPMPYLPHHPEYSDVIEVQHVVYEVV